MSGVYQVSPSTGDAFRLGPKDPPKRFYPKADGTWPAGIPGDANKIHYDRPAGYWGSGRNTQPEVGTPTDRDYSYGDVTAKGKTDTTTLIRASDGKVYTSLPPNTESFILGPVVTSYAINHGYDDYTNLGYIQKDTRQFVLLARIQGFFKGEDRTRTSYGGGNARTWDGSASDLTIYNSNFTLEHALWMRETYLSGNFKANFPFNFAGGIPVDRHPDDGSMGGGDILGTDDGKESKDGDSSGTEQDDPDDNDLDSLDLQGLLNKAKELSGEIDWDAVMDAVNLGMLALDVAAVFALLFPEPGTSIAGATRLVLRLRSLRALFRRRVMRGALNPLGQSAVRSGAAGRVRVPVSSGRPFKGKRKFTNTTYATTDPYTSASYTWRNWWRGLRGTGGFKGKKPRVSPGGQVDTGTLPQRYIDKYGSRSVTGQQQIKLSPGAARKTFKQSFEFDGNYLQESSFGDIENRMGIFIDLLSELPDDKVFAFLDKVEEYGEKNNIEGEDDSIDMKESNENDKKRILREVKRPVLIEATPKTQKLKGYKPNFKGKFSPQNTPDVTASKKSDEAVHGYNTSRMAWTSKDKFWKGYETTERMNVIYDRVGFGQQYFDEISGENLRTKVKKKREVQEHLNQLAHEKAMREVYGVTEFQNKIDEAETYDNKVKDPLFAKVADRLKKEIDYANKPSPHGYPKEAPAKIDPKTGMHPKYGKRYKYDKLDPVSAVMMKRAPTGDPEIDANVRRAAQERKEHLEIDDKISDWMFGKLKRDWRKEIEEGMTTGNMLTAPIPPAGDEVFDDTPTTSADVFADAPARDPGFQYDGLVGTAIKSAGSGSGDNGGFNIGNHVAFDGEGSSDGARWCVLKAVDTTKLDTMVVRAITGNGSNGGETPDDEGEGLVLYYKTPEMYDYIPITYYPTLSNSDFQGGNSTIIPLGHGQSGLQDYQIKIPPHARKEGTRFLLYQFNSTASGRDTYGITNISFRRQTPVNVVVPLDSPEAISFISVGVNEGDPKKRKKRVDDMLKASDEYTAKQMGGQFPGQGTKIDTRDPFAPSPLTDPDSSPIGKDAVTKAFKDFSAQAQAEQEPEVDPTPSEEPSNQATLQPKDEDGKEIEVKPVGDIGVQGADAAKLEAEIETETEVEPEIASTEVDEPEMEPSEEDEDLSDLTDEEIGERTQSWLNKKLGKVLDLALDAPIEVGIAAIEAITNLGPLVYQLRSFLSKITGGRLGDGGYKDRLLTKLGIPNILQPADEVLQDEKFQKLVNGIKIFKSNLTGRITTHKYTKNQIADLAAALNVRAFRGTEYYKKSGDPQNPSMPGHNGATYGISDTRYEYVDDNIYVKDGKVYNNQTEKIPSLANMVTNAISVDGIGKGYGQMIIPKDGSQPYFHFYDYNYNNLNSVDPEEVPPDLQQLGANAASFLRTLMPGRLFTDLRNKASGNINTFLDNLKDRVGLDGWPPGIHGATLTDFKIPLDQLPEDTQQMIANHPLSWTPQRIANMTPEDFRNQGYERFERFSDMKTLDAYLLKAMEDPDSVTDAEFLEYYKRYGAVEYDEKTGTHPGAEKGTVQYDYDRAVEELRKVQDNPDYNKASQAAFKEYEDILAERDKKIDEIGEKYDTGKLWEKLVGPHYRAVQRATKGGGSISKNSPTYQKMIDGYNQYEKQSKVFEQRLSAERSALMDEYGKLSDEAYAKYNDTVEVRKLDDGTMGLVNGGDFKTKNGKIIKGMDTLSAKQQARFDEVRAEYDEVQKYLGSANWDRNFFQAFVLYDVKTQFAESGVSGDNWSPKRTGSGNPSDPKPNKDPGADPNFGSAGDFFGGDATAAATAAAETKKNKKNNKNKNESLEYFANPNGKGSLYEKLKTRGFFDPKDIKPTFPPNDPPEIDPKTKMHANYGKQAGRYKKLDPMSANAMPATGDPEIDAVVDKQRTSRPELKKKEYVKTKSNGDSKNLFKKLKDRKIIKEGMTTQALTGILPSTGEADLVNLQTGLTGDGGIDFGQSNVNDSTMTGDGEYTGLSVMGDITTVEDPTGVGPWFRHRDFDFGDNPSKQSMHGGTYASSSDIGKGSLEREIPGYVPASFRNVRLTGSFSGSNYQNLFGFTDDRLGLPNGQYNNIDGVTRKGYGTALEFSDSGWMATKDIDTTEVDTLKIHARVSDNNIPNADNQTEVYYWAGNKPGFKSVSGDTITGSDGIGVSKPNDGWRPLNQKPDGSFDNTVSTVLIGPIRASNTNNVLQAHTIKLPDWATGPKSRYIIFSKGTLSNGTFSMTSIRFQRKSAKKVRTLMKPLSDVESSPFVRVGPTKKNEGGKERKKKVQKIIRSGLKYTAKQFGKDFPVRTDLE